MISLPSYLKCASSSLYPTSLCVLSVKLSLPAAERKHNTTQARGLLALSFFCWFHSKQAIIQLSYGSDASWKFISHDHTFKDASNIWSNGKCVSVRSQLSNGTYYRTLATSREECEGHVGIRQKTEIRELLLAPSRRSHLVRYFYRPLTAYNSPTRFFGTCRICHAVQETLFRQEKALEICTC